MLMMRLNGSIVCRERSFIVEMKFASLQFLFINDICNVNVAYQSASVISEIPLHFILMYPLSHKNIYTNTNIVDVKLFKFDSFH